MPKNLFSGKLIYSEPNNIYETIEVYLDMEQGFVVKSFLLDHGDGGSSWEVVTLDEENVKKLKKAAGEDLEAFLGLFWRIYARRSSGMIKFQDFLKENGITYTSKYYLSR